LLRQLPNAEQSPNPIHGRQLFLLGLKSRSILLGRYLLGPRRRALQ